ncbi:MAG: S1 RNA-binding domain-containing protein [Clostridia bacterium]
MAVEISKIVNGKVTGITKFGVFVSIPDNKSGMVHISEVSTDYVTDINDHIKIGDNVKVKILGEDEKGRISLSIRKASVPIVQKPNFEDMLSKFKQDSDDKISTLKKISEVKRGARHTK